MIKSSLRALGTTAREFFRNWRAMALFNLLYAALLAALYLFVSTKEATPWQLAATVLLALLAPLLFFIIQAAAVHYMGSESAGAGGLLRRSLRDFWKLLLVSLPVIALAFLVQYLLHKLQARFPTPQNELMPPALTASRSPMSAPPPMPFHWPTVLIASLRLLLLCIVMPLWAIHLWVLTAHEGFGAMLRKSWRIPGRALAPQSILVYSIGLFMFGLMPYFLIFTRTPVRNNWAELFIFGLRLALAFIFTLWGWVITLGALAKLSAGDARGPVVKSGAAFEASGPGIEAA